MPERPGMASTVAFRAASLGRKLPRGVAVAAAAALFLAGCGSLQQSLPPEPPVLASADNAADFTWHHRFVDGWQDGNGPLRLRPALSGDYLYAAYRDGQVVALERDSGRVHWQRQYSPWQSGVTEASGVLYLVSQTGHLVQLDATDGSEMARHDLDIVTLVSPQADNGQVAILGQDGSLGLFDLADESWVWIYDSEQPGLSLHGQMAPVFYRNQVIAGFANGRLVSFDRASGDELWGHRLSEPRGGTDLQRLVDVDAAPVIIDGRLYAVGYEGRLVEIDLGSGTIQWQRELSAYASLAANDQRLFAATRGGEVLAFERRNRALVWQQQGYSGRPLTGLTLWSSDQAPDRLIASDRRGFAHVLSARNGETVGRLNFQGHQYFTVPALADADRFYLQSMQGLVTATEWQPTTNE